MRNCGNFEITSRCACSRQKNMNHEISMIAHARGVPELHGLWRLHTRMKIVGSISMLVSKVHPEPENAMLVE